MNAVAVLSQQPRQAIVELLLSAGACGLPAGVIASDLDILQSSLAVHLTSLLHAGLIECELKGSRIRYRADFPRIREVAPDLLADEYLRFAPVVVQTTDPLPH